MRLVLYRAGWRTVHREKHGNLNLAHTGAPALTADELDRPAAPILQTFRGDRWHFFDLLRAAGGTPKRVALTCYLLRPLLAGLGWLATTGNSTRTITIGIGAAAALRWAALWLGSLRPQAPEPPSRRASVCIRRAV